MYNTIKSNTITEAEASIKGYWESRKIASDNLKKIRRRVEDRLRKANQYEILKCARSLGVKIT